MATKGPRIQRSKATAFSLNSALPTRRRPWAARSTQVKWIKFLCSLFQKRTESLLFKKRSKNFLPILPAKGGCRSKGILIVAHDAAVPPGAVILELVAVAEWPGGLTGDRLQLRAIGISERDIEHPRVG